MTGNIMWGKLRHSCRANHDFHIFLSNFIITISLTVLVFSASAAAQPLTPLFALTTPFNGLVDSHLALDPTGPVLYGEDFAGGAFGKGSLYSLTPPTGGNGPWIRKILFSFNKQGRNPIGGLTFDPASGSYYGVTQNGGPHVTDDGKGNGTVFRFNPAGPAPLVSTVFNFNGVKGSAPKDAPTLDPNGNLIGVTYAGGVAYDPNGTTTNNPDTFPTGGTSGYGVVYSLAPPIVGAAWTETVLRRLGGAPERTPSGPLMLAASGDYYGVTQFGGVNHSGSVYALHKTPSGWMYRTIYSFKIFDGQIRPDQDGYQPTGALVQDPAGNIYGTTIMGGNGQDGVTGPDAGGTVFKLAPTPSGGWNETIIFNFGHHGGPVSGYNPIGGLTLVNGVLYGVTEFGGPSGREAPGTIFSLAPPGSGQTDWTFNLLWSFSGAAPDGGYPTGRLIADSAGNLYGTTGLGGAICQCGVVFKFTPPATAPDVVSFTAIGIEAQQLGPIVNVVVDGTIIATAPVGVGSNTYTFHTTLTANIAHDIQIQYINDHVIDGQDRNLILQSIGVNGTVIPATSQYEVYHAQAGGQGDIPSDGNMYWNGAAEFKLPASVFQANSAVAKARKTPATSKMRESH